MQLAKTPDYAPLHPGYASFADDDGREETAIIALS